MAVSRGQSGGRALYQQLGGSNPIGGVIGEWGTIVGTIASQTDLTAYVSTQISTAIAAKVSKAGDTMTGALTLSFSGTYSVGAPLSISGTFTGNGRKVTWTNASTAVDTGMALFLMSGTSSGTSLSDFGSEYTGVSAFASRGVMENMSAGGLGYSAQHVTGDIRWYTGASRTLRMTLASNGDVTIVGTLVAGNFDTDGALAANSDSKIATQKAVKTYVDAAAATAPGTYTDEKAQDAVAAMIAAGTHTGITFTYSDAGNSMSAVVSGGGGSTSFSVTQAAHGFSVGMPIYFNGTIWAQADRDVSTTLADSFVSVCTAASTTYATLNPSDKSANITLSGGNLIATRGAAAAAAWASVRATQAFIGKHYIEVTSGFAAATDGMATGFGLTSVSLATFPGAVANSYGVVKALSGSNATAYSAGGGGVNYAQNACGVGDVARLCIDVPAGKGWYQQAGSTNWHGGGDPVTGTTPTFTFTPGAAMYFMLALYQSPNTATVNFGASAFTYSVPAGFLSGVFTTTSNIFTYVQDGEITLTAAEWDARTGDIGGLTTGMYYFLSSTTGGLTKTAPTTGNSQVIGKALSATKMLVMMNASVNLTTSGGSVAIGLVLALQTLISP